MTISLIIVALLVVLGGFGGLLNRSPATFLMLFLVFVGLTLIGLIEHSQARLPFG